MTVQLCRDLSKTFQQRVLQIAIDHTDHRYDLTPVETQGVLLNGAMVLIRMAAGIDAKLDGEEDTERCFASQEHYLSMLALLASREMNNATRS